MKLSVLVSRRARAVALVLCLGVWLPGRFASADDKLFLKSGEMLEGTVIEDNATGVKIQVRKGTIKETKSVPRDQIDRIERPKPDEVAFNDLKSTVPVPSLTDLAGYRRLLDAAERFQRDFPQSTHLQEVQKIAEALKAESDKVAVGGLKVKGVWITAEERKAHQENIEAEIQLARIVQMARSGAYLQALRELEKLKTQYPKTKAYVASLGITLDAVRAYGRTLTQALEDRRSYEAAFAERKARMTPAEVQALEAEAAQKQAQIVNLNIQEKKAGMKWLTVNMENMESLTEAVEFVRRDLIALEKPTKVDELKTDAEALYEAESLLAQKQYDAAEAKLKDALRSKAKVLTSKDPHIVRVINDIKAGKEDIQRAAKLAEMEKAQQDAALAKPIVTGGGDTKAGEASAEDALDAMMAQRPAKKAAGSEKPAEPTGKQKGTTSTKGSAKSKSSSGAESAWDDEETSKRPVPVSASASEGGGGLSFPVIMGIVFGLLAAVTAGIYFMSQKRKAGQGGGEGEEG